MVKSGFPIDEPLMDGGITILMHIAAIWNGQAVQQIQILQPDINARDSLGRTALHFACKSGNLDTCRALLNDESCDVDIVTHAGVSPLMLAVESGNIDLVIYGLEQHFNPFLKDALDRSALDYANIFTNVPDAQ